MGGKGLAGELGINTQVCLRQNEGWGGGVVEKMGEWEQRGGVWRRDEGGYRVRGTWGSGYRVRKWAAGVCGVVGSSKVGLSTCLVLPEVLP